MKSHGLGLSIFVSAVAATGPIPVSRSGLAGIDGFKFYDPYCAHGCFRSFSPFQLQCSSTVSAGGHTTLNEAAHLLALCRASSFAYLSSIAWCIHLRCPAQLRSSKIESFWETQITGDISVLPQWSYGEVMANISMPPIAFADASDMDLVLNTTMLTTETNWQATWVTLYYFFRETALESYLGLSLCLTAFAIPIVLTWLCYLPFNAMLMSRIKPLLYSSTIGTFHDQPLPYLIGNAPTKGQSCYIAIIVILNIVFLAVGYKTAWPKQTMQWYPDLYQELMAYFMWRTGVLAFCQMPVLFLFSTRNNLLLWMTNWSHSTYMLLHRWIARTFLLQTLLHSIIALILYQKTGSYSASLKTLWWIWGCVATVAAVVIMLTSFLVFRRGAYELFLVTHIVMAVIFLVACWYHVWYGYENTFGYETWLYATIAVWFLDRALRVARIVGTGLRYAAVASIGSDIVRVDVPGIRWADDAGRCVYVYFPTLNPWKPWENHPFSVIPTRLLTRLKKHSDTPSYQICDSEKTPTFLQNSDIPTHYHHNKPSTASGLTFLIRKHSGATKFLARILRSRLPVLLDGPYPTTSTSAVLRTDRLLLIGGGIGITGLISYFHRHSNVKLIYSVKVGDECLVDALSGVFEDIEEKEIVVGRRLEIEKAVREEVETGWGTIGVVVCGPAGMGDCVRAIVGRLGRKSGGPNGVGFELVVEGFAW